MDRIQEYFDKVREGLKKPRFNEEKVKVIIPQRKIIGHSGCEALR